MRNLLKEYAKVILKEAVIPGINNLKYNISLMKENATLNRDRKRMERAMKMADKMAKAKRKTHYVLKDYSGKPFCASRKEIELLQRGGFFAHKITIFDLISEAYYISRPPVKLQTTKKQLTKTNK